MPRPTLTQFLVGGFPLGLILLGALSFVFYLRGQDAPPPENKLAAMLRKDISQDDLGRYVATLATTLGPRNYQNHDVLQAAASYLESTLGRMNMGYTVQRQTYQVDGKDYHNLIAELRGTSKADEIIVVGAHYDTAGDSPGADDNATGVAALLALAHSLTGTQNQRTIRFVAFTNEEPPFYHTDDMGSRVYARSCTKDGDKVLAMLCLESIGYYDDAPGSQRYPDGIDPQAAGYPDTGNFLAVVGNMTSKRLVDAYVAHHNKASTVLAVGAALPPLIPWANASDHWSFWQEDIPAIMITDTAPLRNPHYHKKSDLPDTIDFARLKQATLGARAALLQLANPE